MDLDLDQTNRLLSLFQSVDESNKTLAWELFYAAQSFPAAAEKPALYEFLTHYSLYHQLIAANNWHFIRAAQQLYLRLGIEYLQHLGNRDWETTQHGLTWEQKAAICRNAIYIKKLHIETSEDSLSSLRLERFLSLKQLCITGKSLCHLPAGLRFLSNLEELDLSHHKISAAHFSPQVVKQWKHLKRINLSHNRFSSFPTALLSLKNLEYINLSHNWFWDTNPLPKQLHKLLPNLKELNLSKCHFVTKLISAPIPNLDGIKVLW